MKTQIVITSQELHTAIAAFLLDELREHLYLAHRKPALTDKVVKAMAEELQEEIDPRLWERMQSSGYWRHMHLAIEDAGFNTWTIARVLSGKWNEQQTPKNN